MGKVYNTVEDYLSVYFEVTTNQPLDTRESVKTFDALLDKETFGAVYETMKVLVQDEDCIYVLVSLPDAEEKNRWSNIGRQFVTKKNETTDLSPNKKLWKRLTIETITEWPALKRAMENLVNGALIYLANDITELDASNNPTSTVHKAGLYFCKNVGGTGTLTMVGGEVTSEQFNELSNLVDTNHSEVGAALLDRYTIGEIDEIIASYSTTTQMNEAIEAAISAAIDVVLEREY